MRKKTPVKSNIELAREHQENALGIFGDARDRLQLSSGILSAHQDIVAKEIARLEFERAEAVAMATRNDRVVAKITEIVGE